MRPSVKPLGPVQDSVMIPSGTSPPGILPTCIMDSEQSQLHAPHLHHFLDHILHRDDTQWHKLPTLDQ